MDVLKANPCDPVERPKPRPGAPSGLSASQMQLLQVIPDTVKGRRDLAIVLTLVLTGRRRSEVVNLTAGDVSYDDSAVFYRYLGKGGVRGRRELPRPALTAIVRSLADVGKDLSQMHPSESLWQAGAGPSGVSSATFYNRFRTYLRKAGLPPSGVHVLRHTAAKLRRDVGESVESVSQFLDHSSLAVTTTYLRRLEGERDTAWHGVANVLGCELARPTDGVLRLTGLESAPVGGSAFPLQVCVPAAPPFGRIGVFPLTPSFGMPIRLDLSAPSERSYIPLQLPCSGGRLAQPPLHSHLRPRLL